MKCTVTFNNSIWDNVSKQFNTQYNKDVVVFRRFNAVMLHMTSLT